MINSVDKSNPNPEFGISKIHADFLSMTSKEIESVVDTLERFSSEYKKTILP